MNLLLTRKQVGSALISFIPLRIGRSVIFKLNAEFELTKEEQALTKKYGFQRASLIYSDFADDLRRAFSPAWFLGLIAFVFSIFSLDKVRVRGIEGVLVKIAIPPVVTLFTVIIMTAIYFFTLRRNITVDQMLNGGRTFYCHSVVELDDLEQELKDLANRFHITLEKAKNWGGRELNPIPEGEILHLSDDDYQSRKGSVEKTFEAAGKAVGTIIGAAQSAKTANAEKQQSPSPEQTSSKPSIPDNERATQSAPHQNNKPEPQTIKPHPLAPRPPNPDNGDSG